MKPKILFIYPSGEPVSVANPKKNIFGHLSKRVAGVLLQPVWYEKNAETEQISKEIRSAMGAFDYRPLYAIHGKLPFLKKIFRNLYYYVVEGLELNRDQKFDVIVAYGTLTTAIGGYILKLLTRKKLVVFIVVRLKGMYRFESHDPLSVAKRMKCKLADFINQWMLNVADHLWLIDSGCVDGFAIKKHITKSVFMDYVSTSAIPQAEEASKYILLLGGPWHRKGVDVLINAFKMISSDFPDYSLKIVGFDNDVEYYRQLAGGNIQIDLCSPVPHDEAMKLLSKCYCYVMASRAEGGGSRVLIEAMAAKKPIIAVNAEGAQFVLKHGFSGLLFEQNNIADLADKLRYLISNPDNAAELAVNAHKYACKNLSEDNYVEHFSKMIETVMATEHP